MNIECHLFSKLDFSYPILHRSHPRLLIPNSWRVGPFRAFVLNENPTFNTDYSIFIPVRNMHLSLRARLVDTTRARFNTRAALLRIEYVNVRDIAISIPVSRSIIDRRDLSA